VDDAVRNAERGFEQDAAEWRPLLVALLRADRQADAVAMLERAVERIHEVGRGLARAAQMEAICGATDRPAFRALARTTDEVGAALEALRALEDGRTGYALAVASTRRVA
jgi:hypothetical protein